MSYLLDKSDIYISMKKSGLNIHLETIEKLKEFKPSGVTWDYFLLELLKAWIAKG